MTNEFSLSEYTKIDVGWGTYKLQKPDHLAGFKGDARQGDGKGGGED